MISTKRQIMKERDRFGGYGMEAAPETDKPSMFVTPSDMTQARTDAPANIFVSDSAAVERREAPKAAASYSAAPAPAAMPPVYSTRETLKPVTELPKRPEKEKAKLEPEDLMPSIKTRRLLDKTIGESEAPAEVEQAAPVARERRQLNAKTKMLLFIYVAVALVLAISVIATGVAISHAQTEAAVIAEQIAAKQTRITEQQAELALETAPDAILDRAISLGMTYSHDAEYTANLIDKTEYPEAVPHTNGFDDMCDWLSGIIN